MTIKIIYIIVFAIIDMVIWLLLNKPQLLSKKLQYLLATAFALFIIVHTGALRSEVLLPWRVFFNLIIVTCAPVLLYAWYAAIKERKRTKSPDENKLATGILSAAHLIFSYLVNIIALVLQVLMILGYYHF